MTTTLTGVMDDIKEISYREQNEKDILNLLEVFSMPQIVKGLKISEKKVMKLQINTTKFIITIKNYNTPYPRVKSIKRIYKTFNFNSLIKV